MTVRRIRCLLADLRLDTNPFFSNCWPIDHIRLVFCDHPHVESVLNDVNLSRGKPPHYQIGFEANINALSLMVNLLDKIRIFIIECPRLQLAHSKQKKLFPFHLLSVKVLLIEWINSSTFIYYPHVLIETTK
jgi:hypothetical protein